MTLVGLVILTAVNMFGIAESAKALVLPTVVFIVSILATIVVGRSARIRSRTSARRSRFHATETVGILLLLKAFASGCSAVTGVEAISNGVPAFRETADQDRTAHRDLARRAARRDADRARAGLSVPTTSSQEAASRCSPRSRPARSGPGWPFYVSNLAVALVLGLAANTSFGGLPVLLSLLAKDHRMPHAFYLALGEADLPDRDRRARARRGVAADRRQR